MGSQQNRVDMILSQTAAMTPHQSCLLVRCSVIPRFQPTPPRRDGLVMDVLLCCVIVTEALDLKDPTGPCISGWGNKKGIKQRFYDICDHGVVLAVGRYLSQLILAGLGPVQSRQLQTTN